MTLNPGAPPVLEIRDLVKRYRNGTLANDRISLALRPGEIYGLLGPNGAGKTTLVRQVLGVLKPTSGTITLDGRDAVADPGFARASIGFLPQGQFDLLSLRVGELIDYSARLRGMSTADARRRRDELAGQLDLGPLLQTSMHAASGGVRRMAGFAAAIAAPARLLVLDEPTNNLDIPAAEVLEESLERFPGTVIVVSHDRYLLDRLVDRVIEVRDGQLRSFEGGYSAYLERINASALEAVASEAQAGQRAKAAFEKRRR